MRSLKQIASELQTLASTLIDISADLNQLAGIDMSALAALIGLEVKPSGAAPKLQPPVDSEDPLHPVVVRKRQYKQQPPSRPLTMEEKDQIRLLWKQSNQDRNTMLPQLASTYQTSIVHIRTILFNNMSKKLMQRQAMGAAGNPSLQNQG